MLYYYLNYIVYLNNDGKSLFGSPWEMMFVNTYLVRTKSGNLLGYSSQFSYLPELGLSKLKSNNNTKKQPSHVATYTMKPYLAVTSLIRLPLYSDHAM